MVQLDIIFAHKSAWAKYYIQKIIELLILVSVFNAIERYYYSSSSSSKTHFLRLMEQANPELLLPLLLPVRSKLSINGSILVLLGYQDVIIQRDELT